MAVDPSSLSKTQTAYIVPVSCQKIRDVSNLLRHAQTQAIQNAYHLTFYVPLSVQTKDETIDRHSCAIWRSLRSTVEPYLTSLKIMFYSYVKDRNGKEPMGTEGKSIRHDLKTLRGAINNARKMYGASERGIVVQRFTNFYDPKTFTVVYDGF